MLETPMLARFIRARRPPIPESEESSIESGPSLVEADHRALPSRGESAIVEDPINQSLKGKIVGSHYNINPDFSVTRTDISADRAETEGWFQKRDESIHHDDPETLLKALTRRIRPFTYPIDQFCRDMCAGVPATRVIDLLPGSGDEHLRCAIRSIRLLDPPPYRALSYTWKVASFERSFWKDDAKDRDEAFRSARISRAIYIGDDSYISVGKGLHDALRCVRHPIETTTLWVDQLSINQKNVSERSAQVQNMGWIYNRAQNGIIWVGESDADSKAALALMEEIAPICRRPDHLLPLPSDFKPDENGVPTPSSDWKSLLKFFTRPVFGRAWVMQEIILARAAIVRCGGDEIDWWKVGAVANLLCQGPWMTSAWVTGSYDQMQGPDGTLLYRPDHAALLSLFRRDFHASIELKLSNLLYNCRLFDVSMPHDRVYALLGIRTARPHDANIVDIEVDYAKPVPQIYSETATSLIRAERSLTPLASAGTYLNSLPSLPSWAADWSSPLKLSAFCSPDVRNPYSATRKTPVSAEWPSPGTLRLRAARIGAIAAVGHTTSSAPSWASYVAQLSDLVAARPRPYPGESDTVDALLCTLLGNTSVAMTAYPVPEGYKRKLGLLLVNMMFADTERGKWDSIPGRNAVMGELVGMFVESGDFEVEDGEALLARQQFDLTTRHRRFFVTDRGHLGLVAETVKVGDEVVVFAGAETPFVVHGNEEGQGEKYELVGDAYVHGVMDGAALGWEGFEWEDMDLV